MYVHFGWSPQAEADIDSLILRFENEFKRVSQLYSFDDKKEVH